MTLNIIEELKRARVAAAKSIYEVGSPTPLQRIELPSGEIFLKREDLSAIRSYKWRGAYNKLKKCVNAGDQGPFVATSAGNHAQGVAVAAAKLGVVAHIFMPRTTPKLKQRSVELHGGQSARINLVGDNFEQTSAHAFEFAEQHQLTVIRPFDDLDVIAGQSIVGDEIIKDASDIDYVFVPIGGGGLASGVAFALHELAPHIKVIGVEVAGQDSMNQSLKAKQLKSLTEVDLFCDGTAVMRPGELTFELCQLYLDRVITVTNEDVCAAIQVLWEQLRTITEPSGAIAFAGLMKLESTHQVSLEKDRCCAVLTGGNTDFLTLPLIVQKSQMVQPSRCYFQFKIREENGSLIELLDLLFEEINIVDFQYGKSGRSVAYPVLGLYSTPEQREQLLKKLQSSGIDFIDVTDRQSTLFRVIPFRPDLTHNATFLHVDFPDRPGALRELMRGVSSITNICYFNFNDSGQFEGHALIGFEFADVGLRSQLFRTLQELHFQYRLADLSGLLEH